MKIFYDMMFDLFGKKSNIFFGKINNWGTFSDEEFLEHQVWNPNHRNYSDFIEEVNRTLPANYCFHNLYEFIQTTKSLI